MNIPLISIIIPVYNAEKDLRQCLDSVVSQTYTNWECILVNDGSTDASGAICDEYVMLDSRFRAIHKENGGVSSARNRGIDNAIGNYLFFLDADDRITDNCINEIDFNSLFDIIFTGYNRIGYNEATINYHRLENFKITEFANYSQDSYVVNSIWYPWGKFFKASIVKENGLYFDEMLFYSEDFEFVMQYLLCSKFVTFSPIISVEYKFTKNRAGKYSMNSKEFNLHYSIINNTLSKLSEHTRCSLDNIRSDVNHRLLNNGLWCISHQENLKDFCSEFVKFYNLIYNQHKGDLLLDSRGRRYKYMFKYGRFFSPLMYFFRKKFI